LEASVVEPQDPAEVPGPDYHDGELADKPPHFLEAREGRLAGSDEAPVGFASVMITEDMATDARAEAARGGGLELELAGMVLRLPPDIPARRLGALAAALRSAL